MIHLTREKEKYVLLRVLIIKFDSLADVLECDSENEGRADLVTEYFQNEVSCAGQLRVSIFASVAYGKVHDIDF